MKKKKTIIVTLFSLIIITSILTLIKVSASDALPYWGCAEKGENRTWCEDYNSANFLYNSSLPSGPIFVRNDVTTDEKWLGPYRYPTIYQGRFGGGAETNDNTPFNVPGIGQIRAYAGQPFFHLIGYEPPVNSTDYPFLNSAARNVIETHRLTADTVKNRYGGNPVWVLPNLEEYDITKKTSSPSIGPSYGKFYWIQDIAQLSGGYAQNLNDPSFDVINGTRLIMVRTSWPDIVTFSSPTTPKQVNSPITFNIKGYEYVSLNRNRVTWDLQVTKDGQTVATKTGTFYSTKGNKNPNKANEYEAGYFDDNSIQWTPTEAGTYSATVTINDQVRRYATKTTSVTVKPVGVEQLEITPSSASILKGTTQQYRAIYTNTSGVETDVTSDVTNTSWSTSSTSIATIGSKTGLATGVNTGNTLIKATYKLLQATADISVYNVPPPPPPPENLPPTVNVSAPLEIKAGDPFCISADASDPDGTLETYLWDTPSLIGSIADDATCGIYYLDEGSYPVTVTVTDDEGATAEDTVYINVLPPTPVASMSVGGTLKENRKVNIDTLSSSPQQFPIDWTKSYFLIEPLDGQNINLVKSRATNVTVSGNQYKITNTRNIESLFKLKGRYQVTHYVENTKGLSDTTTQTVTINEDLKPNADFSTVTTIYRDNLTKNPVEATIRVTDSSYSPDDDIQQRIWTYKYDTNNNGVFEESATTISSANETYITVPVNQVGKYLIELTVVEKFSQPTLAEFIAASDYRKDDTTDKVVSTKIVEVKNLAPTASFEVDKRKIATVSFVIGETIHNDTTVLESKINSIMKPLLNDSNIGIDYVIHKNEAFLSDVVKVDSGRFFSLAVKADGSVYFWGHNYQNSFLPTTVTYITKPVKVKGLSNIVDVSVGTTYALALDANGSVWAWGKNDSYQLGDGTTTARVTPLKVSGLSNITKIAASSTMSYAVDSSNRLYHWGSNFWNVGTVYGGTTPTLYMANVKDVAAYGTSTDTHTYVIKTDETVWAWGYNASGAFLGIGRTETNETSPVKVNIMGNTGKFQKIVTNNFNTMVYTDTGELYVWGRNNQGSLGVGHTNPLNSPLKHTLTGITNVGMTNSLGFAMVGNTTYAFGDDTVGAIGDGTKSTFYNPKVIGMHSGISNITGENAAIYLKNGKVFSSGYNGDGILGDGTLVNKVNLGNVLASLEDGITLTDTINKTNWEDHNFLVSISDKTIQEITDNQTAIVNSLKEENVSFSGLGTSANKTQFESLINANNSNGNYIANIDFDVAIQQLAINIIEKVTKNKTVELQIYVGGSRYNDLAQIETKVNEILKQQLVSQNIDLKLTLKNHNFSASGGTGKVLYRDAFQTEWKELTAPNNVNVPVPKGFTPIGVGVAGYPDYSNVFYIMNLTTGELLQRKAKDNVWVTDPQFAKVPVPGGYMAFGMVSESWATGIVPISGGGRQWRYLSETSWTSTGRANYAIPDGYVPLGLNSQSQHDAVIVNPTTGDIKYSEGYYGSWESYPMFSAPSYGMYSNVKAVPFPDGYVPLGIERYGTDDSNMKYFPRGIYIMHNPPVPPEISIDSDSDYLFVSTFEDNTFSDSMKENVKSQLLTNDGYFIGVGSTSNTSQMQDILTSNSDKGVLINQLNLDMTVQQMADYIIEQTIPSKMKVDLTFALGDTNHNDQTILESKINSIVVPKLNGAGITTSSIDIQDIKTTSIVPNGTVQRRVDYENNANDSITPQWGNYPSNFSIRSVSIPDGFMPVGNAQLGSCCGYGTKYEYIIVNPSTGEVKTRKDYVDSADNYMDDLVWKTNPTISNAPFPAGYVPFGLHYDNISSTYTFLIINPRTGEIKHRYDDSNTTDSVTWSSLPYAIRSIPIPEGFTPFGYGGLLGNKYEFLIINPTTGEVKTRTDYVSSSDDSIDDLSWKTNLNISNVPLPKGTIPFGVTYDYVGRFYEFTSIYAPTLKYQLRVSRNHLFATVIQDSIIDEQLKDMISSEVLINNAYLMGFGTINNQASFNEAISANMEKGKFINNSNIDTALTNLADYIIQEVKNRENVHDIYLSLEEQAEYFTYYGDAENDPKYAERWRYDQNPTVFENNLGYESFNLINLNTPVKQFSKVGRFQTIHAARDNPIWWSDERFDPYRLWSNEADNWYIYVHRKPIPNFNFTINGTTGNYTVTSTSYDLDKQSIDIGFGPGLQSSKYQWREKGQTVWLDGLPSNPLLRKEYEVKLTVKDFQNREEFIVKILDATGVNKIPIADFEPIPAKAYINDNISYKNYSFDPNGDALTYEWNWKLNSSLTWNNGTPTLSTEVSKEPMTKFSSKGIYDVRLRVKDSYNSYSAYVVKQVEIMNRPPKAAFSYSPTTIYNNTNVSFTNSSSDPDNDSLTYKWEFMMPGSSTWTLFSSSPIPTTRTFPTKGDWRIRLTVSDGSQSADTEQILTVGNRSPIANFTYSPTTNLYRGTSITLTDSSTDPDGSADIKRHLWEVQYAGDTTWTSIGTTLNSSLIPTKVGNINVRKTVEDSSGQVSSIIKTITISNRAPSVVISYMPTSNLDTETMISFKATGNDPDTGDIPLLTYKWYFKSPNNTDFVEYLYTDTEIQRRLSVVGSWQVKVVVTDPYGATGQDIKTVNVVDANKPPVAAFIYSPSTIYRDTTVQFTNQSTDPDMQTLTYQWFYQPPNSSTWTNFSSATHPSRIFNQLGTWKIRLVATDPSGANDDEIKDLIVINRPPIAGFVTDKSDYNLGDVITVTSTASDRDNDVLTYNYQITSPTGVKTSKTTANFTLTGSEEGDYTILQTVTDGNGGSDSISRIVKVYSLTIIGKVEHTPDWEAIHIQKGNQPLDFYSGEKFILKANISPQPVEYVKVNIASELINGALINDEVILTHNSPILYVGEYFKDAFANPKTFIKKSPPPMVYTFEVKYSNGIIKKDVVNVNIIGNSLEIFKLGQKF
jgi:alpha-tubulin suppressor-like RCC1 family protein